MTPPNAERTPGSKVVSTLGVVCLGFFTVITAARGWDVERGARALSVELGAVELASRATRLARLPGWEDDALLAALEAAAVPLRANQKTSPTMVDALMSATAAASRVKVIHAHRGPIRAMAVSDDRSRVVTVGDDRVARVWDLQRPGAPVAVLEGAEGPLVAVAFSPDGKRVAAASEDHKARVWSIEGTARLVHTLAGHTDALTSVVFSRDGSRLATGGRDHTARVWDANSGASLGTLDGVAGWWPRWPSPPTVSASRRPAATTSPAPGTARISPRSPRSRATPAGCSTCASPPTASAS